MSQPGQLDQASIDFIEKVGLFGADSGAPRSMSRVMGYLLICQPALQSAEDIQQSLHLSSGSVSTALSMLSRAGLVSRKTFPGQRRVYYELDPDGWKRALRLRLQVIGQAIHIAEAGIAVSPDNPRLQTMYDIYSSAQTEFDRMIKAMGL